MILASLSDDNHHILAIILGKEAHPTFSRLITRSDDIQIDSIRESAKLSREL